MEKFYEIPGIERYKISRTQTILSLYDNRGKYREKVIYPRKMKNGYIRIGLCIDKKQKQYSVHRLIAAAFHGLDLNDRNQLALHRNDIRDDNRPENIFVGTQSDNIQDMLKKKRGVNNVGTRNGMSKLTENDIIEIRNTCFGMPQWKIAKKYNVSQMAICRVLRGDSYVNI